MINRNTISNILKKPYDKVLFAKDILKPVFQNFQLRSEAVEANIELTKTEQKAINKVFIYGTITLSDDTEITCYEILLQPSVHIEQSKVSIQQYVRKLLISGQAALINFVSPVNKDIWRFTLVAKDSVMSTEGAKDVATHAKRYTYLVETGINKHNRTLAERLETLSTTQEQNLQSLINAFSVETLSKAFFDEYKAHYNKFIQYLNGSNFFTSVFKTNDKTVRDFTKKLLGRLVFLYFVQRKGWLGASNNKYKDGNQDFLMNLFLQSGCNDSFYPVWLKTLFFDTLNNPAKNGDFKMPDGIMVKIPFLNGGLFDKDDIDNFDFTIPSELFHNDIQSELPIKRGFIDFLNSFNFTIYEDSPDDHTVAVDPEMLGHIFENLLEDNKDKGAFYTPKQIVHYMCQESLIEYLNTKLNVFEVPIGYSGKGLHTDKIKNKPGQLMIMQTENRNNLQRDELADFVTNKNANEFIFKHAEQIDRLLDEVKICDPAIGSGAFPVGLLHEIFQLKVVLKEFVFEQSASLFSEGDYEPVNYYAHLKENIIQNSIYGVDIEKGAVDIARLRFWLSLVVDEDSPKPLPNLDYKIVEGNSLISKFEDEVLTIDWSSDTAKVGVFAQEYAIERIRLLNEISKKQKEYFHSERTDKKSLSLEIRNLKIDLLISQLNIMIKSKGIDNVQSNAKGTAFKQQTELMLQTQGWKNAIKKLENLKKQPNAHLRFFDWKLDFPEIMNENIVKTGVSPEIFVLNKQIEALNNQIEAVNAAIEKNSTTKLIKIKLLTTENQIKSVETELTSIEKQIKNIVGTISFVDKNIVGEPKNVDYQISTINRKIETINQRIANTNEILLPKSNSSVGFDIIIGNPPYGAKMDEKDKHYCIQNYITAMTIQGVQKGSTDSYTLFIDLGFQICKVNSVLHYIVPISITSSDSVTGVHKLLENNCETIKISSYSVRPQPVFENAVVDVSILFFNKTQTSVKNIYSTKMYRKNKKFNLKYLLNNLKFKDVTNLKLVGRYPKISEDIEISILNKVFSISTNVKDLIRNDGNQIFYRTSGGRYFKVITNYSTGSTKEKPLVFDEKIAKSLGAILSSNLFFWWFQIFSNNHDLKTYEIESFKIPYEKIDEKIISQIEAIYAEYLIDIEKNCNTRQTTKYTNISSFKEYKIGKSKHIIDKIDDIICPLYGLSKVETEFIKNYEIEFRIRDDE